MKKKGAADTAKVFWSGRSQAIRLPREYRLSCREVTIHRQGDSLVLEPIDEPVDENGWPLHFLKFFRGIEVDERLDLGDRRKPHERKNALK
jgi:virulence-associated protein VagC